MKHKKLIAIIGGVLLLISVPYLPRLVDFGEGTDDQAVTLVQNIHKGYQAWFSWAPELTDGQESFRFAAQIALGIALFVLFLRKILKYKNQHEPGQPS
jgi:ABC-type cobalt transport system substrate-binding protein